MKTLNCFVAFVVVLVVLGSVAVADGQSPAERTAYVGLERAVQAMERNPSSLAIGAVQRTVRAAADTYDRVEGRRAQLLARAIRGSGYNTDGGQWDSGSRVWATNWIRYFEVVGQDTATFRAFIDLTRRTERETPSLRDPAFPGELALEFTHTANSDRVATSMTGCVFSSGLCRELRSNTTAKRAAFVRARQSHFRAQYAAMNAIHDAARAVQGVAGSLPSAADPGQVIALGDQVLAIGRAILATSRAMRDNNDPRVGELPSLTPVADLVRATETVLGRLFAFQSGAEAAGR